MRHLILSITALTIAALPAPAHDPGLSSAAVQIENNRLEITLTYNPLDVNLIAPIDLDGDGEVSATEFNDARDAFKELAAESFQISENGHKLKIDPPSVEWVRVDRNDNIRIRHAIQPSSSGAHLLLSSVWLPQFARGHRQLLTVASPAGKILEEVLLDAQNPAIELDLAAFSERSAEAGSFFPFVSLGIEHILTGYDHLLFLLALLIAGGSLLSAAKIITSFTVAHSITLALATFGVVSLPSSIVEPIIAASIVYVAVENLYRQGFEGRWKLTFAFGLIHGLGFASVLREIGVTTLSPLLAFNLGFEAGQVAIAALALPVIHLIQKTESLRRRLVPAGSCAVAAMGAWWLIERTILP